MKIQILQGNNLCATGRERSLVRVAALLVVAPLLALSSPEPLRAQTTGALLLLTNAADAPSTMVPLLDYAFSEDTTLQEASSMGILVTNTGDGDLTWAAASDQPWMSISPSNGVAPAVVTVTVRRSLLASGANYGTVAFTSNGGDLIASFTAGCSDSVSGYPPCGTVPTTTTTTIPGSGTGGPGVVLNASPLSGTAPLSVSFDASRTSQLNGPLSFVWDFGDAAVSGGLALPVDPIQALSTAIQKYHNIHAQWRADPTGAPNLLHTVRAYSDLIRAIVPLTGVHLATGRFSFGFVDLTADYYLFAIGHDLSTIYSWHTQVFGTDTCASLMKALLYAFDAEYYWRLEGGVGDICGLEGTCGGNEIPHATSNWLANNCGPLPSRSEHVFPNSPTGARVTHSYGNPGRFTAHLTITDGTTDLRTGMATIDVGDGSGGGGGGGAPGSYPGFGYQTTGGLGLPIHVVTSLADAGPGTLREALAKAESGGGGTVLFAVGGDIVLQSNLTVPGNTTLDGTTAPGGVTCWGEKTGQGGGTLQIWYSNTIVRNLRIRNSGNDGIQIAPKGAGVSRISRIVVDHCSVTNSQDGGIDVTGYQGLPLSDITLINNYIAGSGRSCSKGRCGGGSLFKYNANRGSFYGNFYDKVLERTPAISGQGSTAPVVVDISYNLVGHTYSSSSMQIYSGAYANVVDNYFLHPPQDAVHAALWGGHVFLLSNSDPGLRPNGNMPEEPVPAPPSPISESEVMNGAGTIPRDEIDSCYVNTAQSWADIKAGVVCPTPH